MPKYSAQLINGKTITLEGETQPSDADFEEAARSAGVALAPAQSQLAGPSHAVTIQQDPSGALKRGVDAALYGAKGVPGIVAGGVKNVVGGVNSVLGLVHASQIPIDTEASNQDQRMGDVATTVGSLIPSGLGVAKGVETAAPLATRAAHAIAPAAGGIVGAAEGYRRGGLPGAVEGGVVGTATGGWLGRLLQKAPGVVKAAEAAGGLPEAVRADMLERNAWMNRATAPPDVPATPNPPGFMGGPATVNPRPLAVHDSQSIRDMMHPEAQAYIESEYKKNLPIFRKMQREGLFGSRGVQEAAAADAAAIEPAAIPSHTPEAPVNTRNRGMTPATTERLLNVHGGQEISLEDLLKKRAMAEPPAPIKRASTPEIPSVRPAGMTDREWYDTLSAIPNRTTLQETQWKYMDDLMHGTGASNRGVGYATRGKSTGK